MLANGRWLYPVIPPSSTTNTGRHEIAQTLLKVTFNTKNHHHHQSNNQQPTHRLTDITIVKTKVKKHSGYINLYVLDCTVVVAENFRGPVKAENGHEIIPK